MITGQQLREWRKSQGLSIEKFSAMVGVSYTTIIKFEKGERKKGVHQLTMDKIEQVMRQVEESHK